MKLSDIVIRNASKGIPPKKVFDTMINAFRSLELTSDLNLFDIKALTTKANRTFYRLRKGKYRAVFHYNDDNEILIDFIEKREVVYKWLDRLD